VELKTLKKRSEAWAQAAGYATHIPQSRPDAFGMLYLTSNPRAYTLHWADPSGIVSSQEFDWSQPVDPLFHYVRTLYQPQKNLPPNDISITRVASFDVLHMEVLGAQSH